MSQTKRLNPAFAGIVLGLFPSFPSSCLLEKERISLPLLSLKASEISPFRSFGQEVVDDHAVWRILSGVHKLLSLVTVRTWHHAEGHHRRGDALIAVTPAGSAAEAANRGIANGRAWREQGCRGGLRRPCRSGVRSSRIQKERPCVATTRSASFTTRSWIGTTGRLPCKRCQCAPSSNET